MQEPTPADSGNRNRFSSLDTWLGGHSTMVAATVVITGFFWRLWLAHATFLNTDEAWHYSVANQDSLAAASKASLTLAHPPLLIFILYFWKHLGTSDVMLRLPAVLAGTMFCWVFYKWLNQLFGSTVALVGVVLAALLPPMVALSAEVRQYSLMLMFAVCAAYFLERALSENSVRLMAVSFGSLYLAMLSHYSAFLFAGTLGIYAILRMLAKQPATAVLGAWVAGQIAGVGLAGLLYATHIAKLGAVYATDPLRRFGDFYLSDWYFHAGRDRLFPFLYRGTFGVFRFIFGQTGVGQIAAILFVAAVIALLAGKWSLGNLSPRVRGALLIAPFVLAWIAVVAGLYPYGRTRQCMFLAIFALAGVSVAIARIGNGRLVVAAALALGVVFVCQVLGTLQGRDMLPLAEQRHEHMDAAVQYIQSSVAPGDVILTDKATSFQLRHYLCGLSPVETGARIRDFDSFRCGGLYVASTGSNDGELRPETLRDTVQRLRETASTSGAASAIWIVQGGWASQLGEKLRARIPEFSGSEVHSYGRYLEIFKVPAGFAGESRTSPAGKRSDTVPAKMKAAR